MQEESTCRRLLLFLFIVCIIRPRRNPNNKYCLKHCVNIEQNYGLSQNDYKLNRGQETTDRSKDRESIKEMRMLGVADSSITSLAVQGLSKLL